MKQEILHSCIKFTESLHRLRADDLDKMKQGSEPYTDRY